MDTSPPQQPPPPPPPPPSDLNTRHFFHPFPLPTTPTTSTSHRKKRPKLLRIDTRGPTKKPEPSSAPTTTTPRPCTECGKKFWSLKALFGHMRCHPERQWRGINPPRHLQCPRPPSFPPSTTGGPRVEDDSSEVAASLLMLAASAAREKAVDPTRVAVFECSSCKKTFGSHQALGGHRATHKKVKGCFAITKSSSGVDEEELITMEVGLGLGLGLELGHRCGICYRVFSSGQALGGHMRCHSWDQSSIGPSLSPMSGPKEAQCGLDLNLPPKLLEDDGSSSLYYSSEMQLDLRLGI